MGLLQKLKKGEQQPFLLFELNIGGIIGIVFIVDDKSNSVKSFWKMGGGEENLFSKRCLPRKTFLQQPHDCFYLCQRRYSKYLSEIKR